MSLMKWALIAVLVLPAAELAAFLLAAMWIGWLWAGLAFVATSVLGVILLRRSGRREFARLTDALRNDGIAALRLDSPAVATLLGAILLVLPGFITDAFGASLFVPLFRGWAASALAKAADRAATKRDQSARDRIIDLAPGEWHQIPDQERARGRQGTRRKSKNEAKGEP